MAERAEMATRRGPWLEPAGANATLEALVRIGDALGVTPDELLAPIERRR